MLKKRFDEEGIVIPFPITALNVEQEGAASALYNQRHHSQPSEQYQEKPPRQT